MLKLLNMRHVGMGKYLSTYSVALSVYSPAELLGSSELKLSAGCDSEDDEEGAVWGGVAWKGVGRPVLRS